VDKKPLRMSFGEGTKKFKISTDSPYKKDCNNSVKDLGEGRRRQHRNTNIVVVVVLR